MDIKSILATMSKHVEFDKLGKDTHGVVLGAESADSFKVGEVSGNLDSLSRDISLGFDEIGTTEDFKISDVQLKLATEAASQATSPVEILSSVTKSPAAPEVAVGAEAINVPVSSYSDITVLTSGFEAFDGATVSTNTSFAMIYTALASKQDPGAELFFPLVPFNPMSSGATVTASLASIINDFDRPISGAKNKEMYKKVSLVKAINDPSMIDVDKNRLVPVLRDDSEEYFLKDLEEVVNENGEDVKTAPLLVGKEVNLLGISQTDGMLSRGTMNITDALDPSLKLTQLYVQAGDDVLKFDIDALGAVFSEGAPGHGKDIGLNLVTEGITIHTTNFKKADGENSEVIAALPANYDVKLKVKVYGDANTQDGDISVYITTVEVAGVTNGGGQSIPEDSDDYKAIVDGLKDMKGVGYKVEGYLTNSNVRVRGTLLTSDKYTAVYTVPFRTGHTILTPVVKNGNDGDADALLESINFARYKLNASAYKTLSKFIAYMRNAGSNAEVQGIAGRLINPYFLEEGVDLTTIVDGLKSSERTKDIKEALLLKLRVAAIDAAERSLYGTTLEAVRPGVKPTVIVVTDPKIGMLLDTTDFTDGVFNYKIRITNNVEAKGRIICSFGLFGQGRNVAGEALNFGHCFIAPDLIIPVVKTSGNGTAVENTVMPRYLHSVSLPLMMVFNVTNVDAVIGKVTVNTSN